MRYDGFICPVCGVLITNLRRHAVRDRCDWQHVRPDVREAMKKNKKEARKGAKSDVWR